MVQPRRNLCKGGANSGISVPQSFNSSPDSTIVTPQLGGYGQPNNVGAYSNVSAAQQYGERHQMGGGAAASQQLVNQYSCNAMQSTRLTQEGFTPEQYGGIERALGGQLKVSLWLAPRLGKLKDYELDFIIDNNISMDQRDGMVHPETKDVMTRLEEAMYRLGHIADLLSHLPVKGITLRSLSDYQKPIRIDITASPHDISQQIKGGMSCIFFRSRIDTTPLYPALCKSLEESNQSEAPRIIYILNDGGPNSGGDADDVCSLLQSLQFRSSKKNTVCLIACTDDASVGWMNRSDKISGVHVVDGFRAEEKEVKRHQGYNFPFNEGFYLMSTLLGPIDDFFDKAHKNHIYSHFQYQEIMGRSIFEHEYDAYQATARLSQSPQASANSYAANNNYGRQYPGRQYPGSR